MIRFSLVAILFLLFICMCYVGRDKNCVRGGVFLVHAHENNVRQKQTSRIQFGSPISIHRGGAKKHQIELNPEYKHYYEPSIKPSAAPTAASRSFADANNDHDEHNAWLLQQQQQQHQVITSNQYQYQSNTLKTTATNHRWNNNNRGVLPSFVSTKSLMTASQSFLGAARFYSERLFRGSPTAFWTTVASVAVFLSWQLLSFARPLLLQFFLASRLTAVRSYGLSLVLSTISHTSFRHLLVNIFVFLNLSPAISSMMVTTSSSSRNRTPLVMWPLLLGGGVFGNLLFLLFRPAGSCLGLSGVTMAMLAVYASAAPDRILRIMLFGIIPVSLTAGSIVQFLLVFSLVGSLFFSSSPIAHLAHLGGLIFGLLYYQNVIIAGGNDKSKFPNKILTW